MMNTVTAVATARYSPKCWWTPSALNASSGPYADDDRPSAPSPTHARNATSASECRVSLFSGSSARPRTRSRTLCERIEESLASSRARRGTRAGPASVGNERESSGRRSLPHPTLAAQVPREAMPQRNEQGGIIRRGPRFDQSKRRNPSRDLAVATGVELRDTASATLLAIGHCGRSSAPSSGELCSDPGRRRSGRYASFTHHVTLTVVVRAPHLPGKKPHDRNRDLDRQGAGRRRALLAGHPHRADVPRRRRLASSIRPGRSGSTRQPASSSKAASRPRRARRSPISRPSPKRPVRRSVTRSSWSCS